MGDPVLITAQEAAERLLTLKMAGWFLFIVLILGSVWLFVMWKYSEDRRKEEADNGRDRIAVTMNIGKAVTDALKDDGNWKEQFIILKAKYDVLEAHCDNMERTLDAANGTNNFGRNAAE